MPPNHLAVYLSNRCNLACSYCYVSVNEGPPVLLDYPKLKASVDFFLDSVPGEDKKITFLGGEPFLNFPLLQDAAAYARRRGGPGLVMQTFTNGTLLTPEKLAALDALEVFVTVSLDGKKATNDARRFFHGDRDRSVFEEAMARLDSVSKENLGVSLVFTSETVGELLANVEFFRRMGFSRITFNPELYEFWPEERLEVLRKTMDGFRRYYKRVLDGPAKPFTLQILFSVLENGPKNAAGIQWWKDCHNVVLGPDGGFYACDKALTFPIGQAKDQVVGRLGEGIDWDARRGLFEEAAAYIEEKGKAQEEYFCPMGVYFYAKEAGQDPARMLDNFHAVSNLFTDGLVALVEENKAHPAFEDLYVRPRCV